MNLAEKYPIYSKTAIPDLSDQIDVHSLNGSRYVVIIKGMAITVNRSELDRLYRQIAVVNQKEANNGQGKVTD